MKQSLFAVGVTGLMVLSSAGTVVLAASTLVQNSPSTGSIILNNTDVSQPYRLVRGGITYMPMWYVMKALNGIGIDSHWTGQDWYLTVPSNLSTDTQGVQVGTGNLGIYVGNTLVQKVEGIVALDPSSKHLTTYMPITSVMDVLNRLQIQSVWNGSTWTMETPAVKVLQQALFTSSNAPNVQLSGTSTTLMHVQYKSPQTGQPTDMTITLKTQGEIGQVNGQKAYFITMTPVSMPSVPQSTQSTQTDQSTQTSAQSVQAPTSIEEYIQGSKAWINAGIGWKEMPQMEQLLQSVQSVMPASGVNFEGLRDIQVQKEGVGYQYTATLDPTAMEQLLGPILSKATPTLPGISASAWSKYMNAVLQNTMGDMVLMVQPISGQEMLTAQEAHTVVQIPMNALPTVPGKPASDQSVSFMTVMSTTNYQYTYNPETLTPPVGLS